MDETDVNTPSEPTGSKTKSRKKRGFWRTFGFVIMIIAAVAVILALTYTVLWMIAQRNTSYAPSSAPAVSETIELNDAQTELLDTYADAVNAAKSEEDFSLNVTTDAALYSVECSVSLFQTLINAVMNTMNTGIYSDETFAFKNGKDGDTTPTAVIQPGYTALPRGSYKGISSVSGTYAEGDDETAGTVSTVEFTVAAEQIKFDDLFSLIGLDDTGETQQEIMDEYDPDAADYDELLRDIRNLEEYQALIAQFPNHLNYVDALSVISFILSGTSYGATEDADAEAEADAGTEFNTESNMMSLNGGSFTLNDMHFTAKLNDDGELEKVEIDIPITLNLNITFFGREIEITLFAGAAQTYTFRYED